MNNWSCILFLCLLTLFLWMLCFWGAIFLGLHFCTLSKKKPAVFSHFLALQTHTILSEWTQNPIYYGGPEGTSQIVNIGTNIHDWMNIGADIHNWLCEVANFVVNMFANINDEIQDESWILAPMFTIKCVKSQISSWILAPIFATSHTFDRIFWSWIYFKYLHVYVVFSHAHIDCTLHICS